MAAGRLVLGAPGASLATVNASSPNSPRLFSPRPGVSRPRLNPLGQSCRATRPNSAAGIPDFRRRNSTRFLSCHASSGGSSAESASSDSTSDASSAASSPAPPQKARVPASVEESVDQAVAAVKRGIADGKRRQLLQLTLPLIGASLLDDWPGGVQQQLQAATPLVSRLLKGVNGTPSESGFTKTLLSDEDAVVQWDTPQVRVVVFPTADTLPVLRQLASDDRPLLLVNPQWQPGQVVSDFGFGRKKQEAEDFLASFATTYYLNTTRIAGSNVTIVQTYPSEWCVYTEDESLKSMSFSGSQKERPMYKQIEGMVRTSVSTSAAGQPSFFERLAKEFQFLKDTK